MRLTAPVSSFIDGIRPLSRLEKNESGTHVKVCRELANIQYTKNHLNQVAHTNIMF